MLNNPKISEYKFMALDIFSLLGSLKVVSNMLYGQTTWITNFIPGFGLKEGPNYLYNPADGLFVLLIIFGTHGI